MDGAGVLVLAIVGAVLLILGEFVYGWWERRDRTGRLEARERYRVETRHEWTGYRPRN